MRVFLVLLAVLVLPACSPAYTAAMKEAVDRTQEVTDNFAHGSMLSVCAITLGARQRLTEGQRMAVDNLITATGCK